MLPPPSTNFKRKRYYQNEHQSNGVYSRDNLPNVKDGTYVLNLNEYDDIVTHRVTIFIYNNALFQRRLKSYS